MDGDYLGHSRQKEGRIEPSNHHQDGVESRYRKKWNHLDVWLQQPLYGIEDEIMII